MLKLPETPTIQFTIYPCVQIVMHMIDNVTVYVNNATPEPDAVYNVACSVCAVPLQCTLQSQNQMQSTLWPAVSLQCTLQWYFPFHDTLCHAV